MLDVVRIVALAIGLIRSLRLRSLMGAVAGSLLAYGFIVIAVQVAGHRKDRRRSRIRHGIALSGDNVGSVAGNSRIPGGIWLSSHPILRHVTFAALALAPFVHASRWSSRLRPESAEARQWDALGTPFLLLAVIELSLAVLAVLWAQLHWS